MRYLRLAHDAATAFFHAASIGVAGGALAAMLTQRLVVGLIAGILANAAALAWFAHRIRRAYWPVSYQVAALRAAARAARRKTKAQAKDVDKPKALPAAA